MYCFHLHITRIFLKITHMLTFIVYFILVCFPTELESQIQRSSVPCTNAFISVPKKPTKNSLRTFEQISTRIRACEQLQKFCEHEQVSTRLNFASKSSKGQILRALGDFQAPFNTPSDVYVSQIETYLTQLFSAISIS